jgi:hypothetical protein
VYSGKKITRPCCQYSSRFYTCARSWGFKPPVINPVLKLCTNGGMETKCKRTLRTQMFSNCRKQETPSFVSCLPSSTPNPNLKICRQVKKTLIHLCVTYICNGSLIKIFLQSGRNITFQPTKKTVKCGKDPQMRECGAKRWTKNNFVTVTIQASGCSFFSKHFFFAKTVSLDNFLPV